MVSITGIATGFLAQANQKKAADRQAEYDREQLRQKYLIEQKLQEQRISLEKDRDLAKLAEKNRTENSVKTPWGTVYEGGTPLAGFYHATSQNGQKPDEGNLALLERLASEGAAFTPEQDNLAQQYYLRMAHSLGKVHITDDGTIFQENILHRYPHITSRYHNFLANSNSPIVEAFFKATNAAGRISGRPITDETGNLTAPTLAVSGDWEGAFNAIGEQSNITFEQAIGDYAAVAKQRDSAYKSVGGGAAIINKPPEQLSPKQQADIKFDASNKSETVKSLELYRQLISDTVFTPNSLVGRTFMSGIGAVETLRDARKFFNQANDLREKTGGIPVVNNLHENRVIDTATSAIGTAWAKLQEEANTLSTTGQFRKETAAMFKARSLAFMIAYQRALNMQGDSSRISDKDFEIAYQPLAGDLTQSREILLLSVDEILRDAKRKQLVAYLKASLHHSDWLPAESRLSGHIDRAVDSYMSKYSVRPGNSSPAPSNTLGQPKPASKLL